MAGSEYHSQLQRTALTIRKLTRGPETKAHERRWTIEEMNIEVKDVRNSQFCIIPFFVFQMTLCNANNARCLSGFIEICLHLRCKTSKGTEDFETF